MVPLGTSRAASLPISSAARACSRLTVGSSPNTSSPSSAADMARRISSEGWVTVSERRSINGVATRYSPPETLRHVLLREAREQALEVAGVVVEVDREPDPPAAHDAGDVPLAEPALNGGGVGPLLSQGDDPRALAGLPGADHAVASGLHGGGDRGGVAQDELLDRGGPKLLEEVDASLHRGDRGHVLDARLEAARLLREVQAVLGHRGPVAVVAEALPAWLGHPEPAADAWREVAERGAVAGHHELVAVRDQHVAAQASHVDPQRAERLRRVHHQQHAPLAAEPADRLHRDPEAAREVDEPEADDAGARRQQRLDVLDRRAHV